MKISDFLSMEDLQTEELDTDTSEQQLELERQVIEYESKDLERDLDEHRRMVDTITEMEEQNEVITELAQRGELTRPVAAGFIAARRAAAIALGLDPDEEGGDLVDAPAMESMISGVSLEEETKNEGVIKKAWEAAKKFIKMIIDKIVGFVKKIKNFFIKNKNNAKQNAKTVNQTDNANIEIINKVVAAKNGNDGKENVSELLKEEIQKSSKVDKTKDEDDKYGKFIKTIEPLINDLHEVGNTLTRLAVDMKENERDHLDFHSAVYGVKLIDYLYNTNNSNGESISLYKSIENLKKFKTDILSMLQTPKDELVKGELPVYYIGTSDNCIKMDLNANKHNVVDIGELMGDDKNTIIYEESLHNSAAISNIANSFRFKSAADVKKRINEIDDLIQKGFRIVIDIDNEIDKLRKEEQKITELAMKYGYSSSFVQLIISKIITAYRNYSNVIVRGTSFWSKYLSTWAKVAKELENL